MKHRIFALALLLCMLLSLSVSVQAKSLYDEVEKPAIGGKYYLCVTIDGTDYYYRVTNSTLGESVTDTNPYSLYLSTDPDDKLLKEFTLGEVGAGFYMGYPSGDNIHKLYAFDVDKDDVLDTGLNSGLDANRHCFFWDAANRQIFTMQSGRKFIFAAKSIRNLKTGKEEYHIVTVPASELNGKEPVYPVRFVSKHVCEFSKELTSNQYSHWHACKCGEKSDLQLHTVESWTVTKEAAVGEEGSRTGTCTVCGATAVESIPALKDRSAAPRTGDKEQEAEETGVKLDPVVTAVAGVLVVLGVFILIFGKKREKNK